MLLKLFMSLISCVRCGFLCVVFWNGALCCWGGLVLMSQ